MVNPLQSTDPVFALFYPSCFLPSCTFLPRWLYWTDWGDTAYIGRAGMDGTNVSAIITTKLEWPSALTIDYTTNKIFFADSHLNFLEWVLILIMSAWTVFFLYNRRSKKPVITLCYIDIQLCRHGRPEPTPGHRWHTSPCFCSFPVWGLGLLDRLEHTCSGEGPQVHRRRTYTHGQQHTSTLGHSHLPPLQTAAQYVHFNCRCLSSQRTTAQIDHLFLINLFLRCEPLHLPPPDLQPLVSDSPWWAGSFLRVSRSLHRSLCGLQDPVCRWLLQHSVPLWGQREVSQIFNHLCSHSHQVLLFCYS